MAKPRTYTIINGPSVMDIMWSQFLREDENRPHWVKFTLVVTEGTHDYCSENEASIEGTQRHKNGFLIKGGIDFFGNHVTREFTGFYDPQSRKGTLTVTDPMW